MLDISEKNVRKNMALSTVYRALSMVISYLYVPVVLAYLGEVKYGVWTTILNVLSWITYFDIGIGHGLRNKLAENLDKEGNEIKCRKYVSSAYFTFGIIVLCAMCVFSIGAIFVNWNGIFGVSKDKVGDDLTCLMCISVIFMCINFLLSLCKSIYYALQKNSTVGLMGVLQQSLMLFGVLYLSVTSKASLLKVAIFYGLSDFIVEVLFTLILRRKSEIFVPSIKFVSREETKSTTNLGVLFFISQISALILFTTDNLIISHFIGPADVTSYSMVNKLYTAGTAVFAMLVTPYWSRTSVAKSHDDYNLIKKGIREMQYLWGVGIVGVLVLMIVFKPLAKVWLQKELYYAPGLIPLMAIYSIIYMWNAIYSQVANGLSLMKVIVPVGIIQGKAIRKINNNDVKVIFDVIGPSADTIKNMIKCDNPVQYGINCHGRLSHENTLSIVKKADFSVLMRENKRYAKAGVSTKFVEAMSLAVPSICTAVGGTDAFVRDGVDGFLIKDNSVYEILGKLELIVNMDSSEILQMKLNALNKAKHVFSEDQYFEVTKLFLKGKVFDGQQ